MGSLRRGRRTSGWRRLHDHLRCNRSPVSTRTRRRRLPNARPGDSDERPGHADGGLQPDGRRPRTAREHVSPHGPRNPGLGFRRDGRSGAWSGRGRSRSRIAGFAATRRAATVCRSGRDRPHVPSDVGRRQPPHALQRDRAKRGRQRHRALGRVADRDRATAGGGDSTPERRDLDPCGERAPRPASDRLAGRVLPDLVTSRSQLITVASASRTREALSSATHSSSCARRHG